MDICFACMGCTSVPCIHSIPCTADSPIYVNWDVVATQTQLLPQFKICVSTNP